MMIVKDTMVLIHLAKTSLLADSCALFERVLIPQLVYDEVMDGKEQHPQDVNQLQFAIKSKLIQIKKVEKTLVKKANEFNIYRGEAEAVGLYWQEKADLLATDDDNVRKKKEALRISTIGTPAIMIKLFRAKKIDKPKYVTAIKKLKEIGWFSSTVFDKMLQEVNNG